LGQFKELGQFGFRDDNVFVALPRNPPTNKPTVVHGVDGDLVCVRVTYGPTGRVGEQGPRLPVFVERNVAK
jgi:hypothetical protein